MVKDFQVSATIMPAYATELEQRAVVDSAMPECTNAACMGFVQSDNQEQCYYITMKINDNGRMPIITRLDHPKNIQ